MAHKLQNLVNNNPGMQHPEMPSIVRLCNSKISERNRLAVANSKVMKDISTSSGRARTLSRERREQDPLLAPRGDSLLRKEVYADSGASVEVTVKTRKPKSKRNASESSPRTPNPETWGHILKSQQSNENMTGFKKFDPLRTIHFLSKELESQLRNNVPDQSPVFDVISEMQYALKRIPKDVQAIADVAMKKNKQPKEICNKVEKAVAVMKSNGCQTPAMWFLEPLRLQQHLEESSEKIEKACQQMEMLCSKLKSEKQSLELQLQIEKDNNYGLNKQVEEYKTKLISSNAMTESLKHKNNDLLLEIEQQKVQLDFEDSTSAIKFKTFIKELQTKKDNAENECVRYQHQLQVAKLENEKYKAFLEARDMQVKEIRFELTQLQEVVKEQLCDFRNLTSSEDVSPSDSNNTNVNTITHTVTHSPGEVDTWKSTTKRIEYLCDDNDTLATMNSEPVQELFNNQFNQYDAQSVDSTPASTDDQIAEMQVNGDMLKLRHVYKIPIVTVAESASLRKKFLELKRQAATVIHGASVNAEASK